MARVLMYASVASMIQQFNMENIQILLEQGYQVDVACNMEQGSTISIEKIADMKRELERLGVGVIHLPIPRNIAALGQIVQSLRLTKKLINENGYDMVHCHSPIGGMVCRLANRLSKQYKKTKMIYTAHGFHFFKGAPLKNWLLYYPVEWLCSFMTDTLITINQEDYTLAKKRMHAKRIEYIPGVGIDLKKFGNAVVDKASKRKQLGVPENKILLLSVGELNENKNHETVIRAIADMSNVYYIIAGKGGLQEYLQGMINELNLETRVKLLGFRKDVGELLKMADVYVMPSFREGLSVALMEAMASGLPCIVSKIRGNTDLIDENGGKLFDPYDTDDCKKAISRLITENLDTCGKFNEKKIKQFSSEVVNGHMKHIYNSIS